MSPGPVSKVAGRLQQQARELAHRRSRHWEGMPVPGRQFFIPELKTIEVRQNRIYEPGYN